MSNEAPATVEATVAETTAPAPAAPATPAGEHAQETAPAAPGAEIDPAAAAQQAAAQAKQQAELRSKKIAERLKLESQVRKQLAETRAERESLHREVAQVQQVKTHLAEFIQRLRDDPIAVLNDEFGLGPEEYLGRAQNGGKPTRGEELGEELRTYKREMAELKAWRAQQEAERAQQQAHAREQAELRAQQQAVEAHRAAQDDFWGLIAGNKAAFPDLNIYTKDMVLKVAAQVVAELGDEAESLSYEELAQQLQESTRQQHELIRQGFSPQEAAEVVAAAPPAQAPAGTKTPARLQTQKRGSSREATEVTPKPTLNSSMAGRASAKTDALDVESVKKQIIAEMERNARLV